MINFKVLFDVSFIRPGGRCVILATKLLKKFEIDKKIHKKRAPS
jgi:hypothetical protein